MVPWHFNKRPVLPVNTTTPSYSGCDLELGAIDMPRVMQVLRRIGKEIVDKSQVGAVVKVSSLAGT